MNRTSKDPKHAPAFQEQQPGVGSFMADIDQEAAANADPEFNEQFLKEIGRLDNEPVQVTDPSERDGVSPALSGMFDSDPESDAAYMESIYPSSGTGAPKGTVPRPGEEVPAKQEAEEADPEIEDAEPEDGEPEPGADEPEQEAGEPELESDPQSEIGPEETFDEAIPFPVSRFSKYNPDRFYPEPDDEVVDPDPMGPGSDPEDEPQEEAQDDAQDEPKTNADRVERLVYPGAYSPVVPRWKLDSELIQPLFAMTLSETPLSELMDRIRFRCARLHAGAHDGLTFKFDAESKIPYGLRYLSESLLFCLLETILERDMVNESGSKAAVLSIILESGFGYSSQAHEEEQPGAAGFVDANKLNNFNGLAWLILDLVSSVLEQRYSSDSALAGLEVSGPDRINLVVTEIQEAVNTAVERLLSEEPLPSDPAEGISVSEDEVIEGSCMEIFRDDALRQAIVGNLYRIIPSSIQPGEMIDAAHFVLSAGLLKALSSLLGGEFTPGQLTQLLTGFCDKCGRCTDPESYFCVLSPDYIASMLPLYPSDIAYPPFTTMCLCAAPMLSDVVPKALFEHFRAQVVSSR